MKSRKIISILILIIICLSLYRCKPEEIILHGEISGIVTDTTTSQPLQAVAVKLNPINDTTSTSIDGKYLFKNLIPGEYNVEVSKPPYATGVRIASVTSANITGIDFALHQIPYPELSDTHLDFGSDSTQKSFTITNTGTGILDYSITTTSQDWITVNPNIGEITTEPQIINLTIDRTGLSEKKHVEWVEIVFHVGRDLVQDTVYVCLNGVMDQDYNYYNIVTIGTQKWMAENLKTGRQAFSSMDLVDNEEIEKYCYDNNKSNCDIYGGLYTWAEAMNYLPQDTGKISNTQGICPVGWHIPSMNEWLTLSTYLVSNKGGALKETGFAHWDSPNLGANNLTGFTALGAGWYYVNDCLHPTEFIFGGLGQITNLLSSETSPDFPGYISSVFMTNGSDALGFGKDPFCAGVSVRCIKDPPKK
jgi:uncharacterized protein (TIGR02145 family)